MPGLEGASSDADEHCKSCPQGKYLPTEGAISAGSCKDCEKGKFQGVRGQGSCKECNKGKYLDETASTGNNCKKCLAGRFGDQNAIELLSEDSTG